MRRGRLPLACSLLTACFVACGAQSTGTNCLVNATYSPSQRKLVTLKGEQMKLKIPAMGWTSALIESYIYKYLVEEIIGIQTQHVYGYGSSYNGYLAVSGCQDPTGNDPQCGGTAAAHIHVLMECWDFYAAGAQAIIRSQYESSTPIFQGSMGFAGRDGFFVTEPPRKAALAQKHLPLEYYKSYGNRVVDPSQFFSNISAIPTSGLSLCSETNYPGYAENYDKLFKDPEGVIKTVKNGTVTWNVNCSAYPHWWLSPSCRSDPMTCIPVISRSGGWGMEIMFHRAAAWNLPVALAVSKTPGLWKSIPTAATTLLYWWFPDDAFIKLGPIELIWPPHNKLEWAVGNYRGDASQAPTKKWSYYGLEGSGNSGFDRPLGVLKNMQFGFDEVFGILKEFVRRTDAVKAAGLWPSDKANASKVSEDEAAKLACDWLKNNTATWEKWIPKETQCLEGQGLINAQRLFVPTRSAAKSCRWCVPGKVSEGISDMDGRTFKCSTCPPGQFQANLGMTECEQCKLGTVPSASSIACEPCEVGKFLGQTGVPVCNSCPGGFTTLIRGATSSDSCICEEGLYRDAMDRTCQNCPEGMTCPKGSDALGYDPLSASLFPVTPRLTATHWSSAEDPFSVFRCASTFRCPGNRKPDDACAENLESRACAHCKDGYVWGGDRCTKCGSKAASAVIFPGIPLLLSPLFIVTLYTFGGDPYVKWGSWRNGLSSTLFILLNHYQIVSILAGVDVNFPAYVSNLLGTFKLTTDVLSVFKPGCIGIRGFEAILWLKSSGPVVVGVLYILTWSGAWLIGLVVPRARMEPNRTLNGFMSLILTFFIAIAQACFTIFKCMPNPNNTSSLLEDRSVLCGEDTWKRLLSVGLVAMLLWCVGFGLVFVLAIVFAPRHFHMPGVQARWKFLFIRYRPDVHWWAIMFVSKGIILNLGFIFLSSGVSQVLWVMGVCTAYAGLVFVYRPWRHMLNNGLDLWVHLNINMACAPALWFAWSPFELEARTDVVNKFIMAAIICIFLPFIPSLIIMFLAQTNSGSIKRKHEETLLILDSFEQVNAVSEDERRSFLEGLDEMDFWFMIMAKDILQTEFAKRRCRAGYSAQKLAKVPLNSIQALRASSTRSSESLGSLMSQKSLGGLGTAEMRFIDL